MKTKVRTVLCAALCVLLALSLTGCGMLKTIRENARRASEIAVLETPAEDTFPALFNAALDNAEKSASKVTETVSLSVGKPQAVSLNDAESSGAKVFAKTADALKNIILMDGFGSGERELTPDALGDTLLSAVDAADVKGFDSSRNEANVPVTDEDGEPVTDEQGNNVYEKKVSNNYATLKLFFNETETSVETDGDGNEKETVTDLPADAALVEKVFGPAMDAAEVEAQLAKLSDYLTVNGYELTYTRCVVSAVVDLDTNLAHEVSYEKNFTVTANVTGKGVLAEVGDLEITFSGKITTEYTFEFEAEDNDAR